MLEQNRQEIPFGQYSVLLKEIGYLRDELRASNLQMEKIVSDHEERLRRNELLIVIGLFLIVLAAIVVFFVVREIVLRGG